MQANFPPKKARGFPDQSQKSLIINNFYNHETLKQPNNSGLKCALNMEIAAKKL